MPSEDLGRLQRPALWAMAVAAVLLFLAQTLYASTTFLAEVNSVFEEVLSDTGFVFLALILIL